MEPKENTKKIVRLEERLKYISAGIDSIQSTLKELSNSVSSIRNDVNQANTKAINNKVEIERQKQQFAELESKVDKNTNFRKNFNSNVSLVKWFASFIGFSNLILIIVLFAQFSGIV